MEHVVFDASTLILLAKTTILAEALGLVQGHAPSKVLEEVRAGEGTDVSVVETALAAGRLGLVDASGGGARLAADFGLGSGEAEALGIAVARDWVLACDDRKALVSARSMRVRFATAVHFLLELRSADRLSVEEALAKLERLAVVGRYSRRILDDARARLRGAGGG